MHVLSAGGRGQPCLSPGQPGKRFVVASGGEQLSSVILPLRPRPSPGAVAVAVAPPSRAEQPELRRIPMLHGPALHQDHVPHTAAAAEPPATQGSAWNQFNQQQKQRQYQQHQRQQQQQQQQQQQLIVERLERLARNGDLPGWQADLHRQLALDASMHCDHGTTDAVAAALVVILDRCEGRKGSMTRARQLVRQAGGGAKKEASEGKLRAMEQHWQGNELWQQLLGKPDLAKQVCSVQKRLAHAGSSPEDWLVAAQRLAGTGVNAEAAAQAVGNLLCGVELARNGANARAKNFAAFRSIQQELGVPASYLGALQALHFLQQPPFQGGGKPQQLVPQQAVQQQPHCAGPPSPGGPLHEGAASQQQQRRQQQREQQQREQQQREQQPALSVMLRGLAAAGCLCPHQVPLALGLAGELGVGPLSRGAFCAALLAVVDGAKEGEAARWLEAIDWQRVLGAVERAGGRIRGQEVLPWLDHIIACWKANSQWDILFDCSCGVEAHALTRAQAQALLQQLCQCGQLPRMQLPLVSSLTEGLLEHYQEHVPGGKKAHAGNVVAAAMVVVGQAGVGRRVTTKQAAAAVCGAGGQAAWRSIFRHKAVAHVLWKSLPSWRLLLGDPPSRAVAGRKGRL